MIAGPWFITPHAVAQYRDRFQRSGTYEQLLGELVEQCRVSHRVKVHKSGAEVWRTPRPLRARLIVRDGVLMTVLYTHDRRTT